jgi:hypothetical protein
VPSLYILVTPKYFCLKNPGGLASPGDLRLCVYSLTATLTNNRKTRGRKMEESNAARETRLRELASRLLFTLSKEGSRFSLFRDTDVPQPVRHDGLTLDEVEETLNTWKLRGPHGG